MQLGICGAALVERSLFMDKFFTTNDAATYLEVTQSRVRQFILGGRLESIKMGRDHLIKESDLVDFKENGKLKRGRPSKRI